MHGELDVNGISLHYDDVGQGQPLILVHGFMGAGAMWDPLKEALTDEYRVIVPDLRGHGASTNSSAELTHDEFANDLMGLMDQLDLEATRAIGFSSGALALLRIAIREPARIEKVILISAPTERIDIDSDFSMPISIETTPPDRMERLRGWHIGGDEQIERLYSQFRTSIANDQDRSFSATDLGRVMAQTLIIHGDRDQVTHPRAALDLYDEIPDAYLWVVPNGSHKPYFADSKASWNAYVARITDFLSGPLN